MECKYCKSLKINKIGHSSFNGKQRYKCNKCNKTWTEGDDKRIKHSLLERKMCITTYLTGLSMRGIQKALSATFNKKIHIESIAQWIKNADKILQEELEERKKLEKDKVKSIEILEMDELFTYIKKPKNSNGKKYCDKRVWTALDRNKGIIIDFKVGNNNITNATTLIHSILTNNGQLDIINDKDKLTKINYLCSD